MTRLRELFTYWTTDNGAPYTRIEYQVNKAGHSLLIGLAIVGLLRLFHLHVDPLLMTIAAVIVYWSADWWAPFADHKHTSDHPVAHFTAKLIMGMLAPVLLVSIDHPWWLVAWFVVYLPVLLFQL